MAVYELTPFEENQRYLTGETDVIPITGAPPTSTLSASGGTAGQPSLVGGVTTDTGGPTPPASFEYPTQGGVGQRLVAPLETGITGGREQLTGLREAFQEAAGPTREFTEEDKALLQRAFTGGAPEDITAAQGLVGATYTGPTGLDSAEMATLTDAIDRLTTKAAALRTGGGLAGYIQQAVPGLTPGEAQYEAQHLLSTPEFMKSLPLYQQQAQQLKAETRAEAEAAKAFAEERAQQEKDLARQSRELLEGEKAALEEAWQGRITAGTAQQQAVTDAIQKWLTEGEMPAGELFEGGKAPETPYGGASEAAQAKWDEVTGRYPDIADIPLPVLGTDSHGRERYYAPQEWLDQDPGNQARWDAAYPQIEARQKELEAWFAPRPTTIAPGVDLTGANVGWQSPGTIWEGEFSWYKPLYFGGDENVLDVDVPTWKPPDPLLFASHDPGVAPSRANVATQEEAEQFNNIGEILGSTETLDKLGDTEPFRAAAIAVDIEAYLKAAEALIEKWNVVPTERAAEWKGLVRKTRKRYEKAKKRNEWGSIANIATFSGGSGLEQMEGSPFMEPLNAPSEKELDYSRLAKMSSQQPGE